MGHAPSSASRNSFPSRESSPIFEMHAPRNESSPPVFRHASLASHSRASSNPPHQSTHHKQPHHTRRRNFSPSAHPYQNERRMLFLPTCPHSLSKTARAFHNHDNRHP